MAKEISFWHRNKYYLNALVLILPAWFYYQSQNPQFPDALPAQQLEEFTVVPMPYNEEPPYLHDGLFVKDFLLMFNKGDISAIRQAYLNIGPLALPLSQMQERAEGILHGSPHGQHVHALTSEKLQTGDKIWLTVERWDGQILTTSWSLPEVLVN